MRIEHLALWTDDIDRLVGFYQTYFEVRVEGHYTNPAKGFESRFLRFGPEARLEIMRTTRLSPIRLEPGVERMGLTHIAISVGSERRVDDLTERLRQAGYPVLDGPRRTGDGYYEAVVLDPDGNRLEITA